MSCYQLDTFCKSQFYIIPHWLGTRSYVTWEQNGNAVIIIQSVIIRLKTYYDNLIKYVSYGKPIVYLGSGSFPCATRD